MRILLQRALVFAAACAIVLAQGPSSFSRPANPYSAPKVPPVPLQTSPRIFELMRAGQLYLSLDDAIALALENNLDIELERALPTMAGTDLLRARGGGLLRGLSLLVNEPAPGIGGPNGPLLTNLTAGSTPSPLVNSNFSDIALISEQQNSLSVTDPTPMASGPAIPQYRSHRHWPVECAAPHYTGIQYAHNWFELAGREPDERYCRGESGARARHSARRQFR